MPWEAIPVAKSKIPPYKLLDQQAGDLVKRWSHLVAVVRYSVQARL